MFVRKALSPERHPPVNDLCSGYAVHRCATKCGDLLPWARVTPGSHPSLSFSMGGSPLLFLAFCIQEIHGIIHGLEH